MSAIMYSAPATYPMPAPDVEQWEAKAACRGENPEWWLPADDETRAAARAICNRCPVKERCLEANGDMEYGVIGGLTATQRKRRQALPAECKHGHEFTPENTHITPEGWRACRECQRERSRRAYERAQGDAP